MLSVPQIRSLQGSLTTLLGAPRVMSSNATYQTLVNALQEGGREAVEPRLVYLLAPDTPKLRGLFFRFQGEPAHTARLVLPDNREPPASFHLDLPATAHRETLLELSYVHTRHRRVTPAHYLLAGALTTFPDSKFEYARQGRKNKVVARLAELLYRLNTPLKDLPYPEGRKLSTLAVLEKLGIRYLGELVQRKPEDVKAALRHPEWLVINGFLKDFERDFGEKLGIRPGAPIPQWRAPK